MYLVYFVVPNPLRRDFISAVIASGAAAVLPRISSSAENSPKPAIKIGQIGVGHAHASKLGVYRTSPDYEVVGIVEPDAKLRSQAEQQPAFRDLKWLTEEELLKTPGLAAVLVETHVRDLLSTAERCIAAGKHIHLDKPAGASLPQYQRVLEAASKQNLLAQMGYMFRYNPGVVLLRQFLKEGWLGDVFEVHTVMSKVVPPDQRRELAEFSGGIMFELGCHVIDLVVGVLGKPLRVLALPRRSGPRDGLNDNMLAVFEYQRATATVRSSALEVDGGSRRHLTVCGTGGTFHIQPLDAPSVKLTLDQPHGEYKKGTQEIKFEPPYRRYVADAADMARILRGEKQTDFNYAHDLAVQETVLKASGMALN